MAPVSSARSAYTVASVAGHNATHPDRSWDGGRSRHSLFTPAIVDTDHPEMMRGTLSGGELSGTPSGTNGREPIK